MRQICVPRRHQHLGTSFLLDTPRSMLVADMGLGKTLMVLRALDLLKHAGSNYFPALVIAPLRVAQLVWSGELDKWDVLEGLTLTKILGKKDLRMDALRRPRSDIYVINYENIPWLVSQLRGRWPFKIVIADESTKLKNFRLVRGGMRAAALARVAKETGRWINLTGTPAPNGLTDLWGQYWFLDFGQRLHRTYTSFLQTWFEVNEYTHEVRAHREAEAEIHDAIKDITMVLRAEDWLGVQKPMFTRVPIELPGDARKLYTQMADKFFAELNDTEIEAVNSASKSGKLLQLAAGAIYDADQTVHPVHEAKLDALEEVVEEAGEPVLVAYWWKFDVARICKRFPQARLLETEQDVRDWNAGRVPLMLIHPASAGHGLNLQDGGRTLVFYSSWWDLELRQQVIERIGPARQLQAGYNRTVRIYDIVAQDTLDNDLLERLDSKISVQDALKLARARR